MIGIEYEIGPPRLCCLRLALICEDGTTSRNKFTIKYHDMTNVLDFLVLRQTYEISLAREWSENDRFRCMIDFNWWTGEISSKEPYDADFPDSNFLSYKVMWDGGEIEQMCPWDFEPIDEDRKSLMVILRNFLCSTCIIFSSRIVPRSSLRSSCVVK